MIVDRAFYRETTQTALAVTAVFIILYLVIGLVGLMAKAASGKLPAQMIFALLGLQTVKNLSIILPLALFIAVLLTLGRWYRDSEMTVLAACGIGLPHFLRPTWIVSLWVAGMVALISFYLGPLASSLITKLKQNNTPYELGVVPGEFNRAKRGGTIFYVERIARDTSLYNIFVSHEQLGKRGVLVAKSGYEFVNPSTGDQFLVLQNGTRYEGIPGKADYKILHYQTYAIRMEQQITTSLAVTSDETPTSQLWGATETPFRVEWHWRLAKPLSLFILTAFALVFAYTDARRGRFANMFTAILIYFIYANLLGVGHAMLRQGRLPVEFGLWWVHIGFAVLAAYLLWRRSRHLPLLPSIKFKRAPVPVA